VSDDFAAHLVNDCRVAEYLDVIEPTDTPQPDAPETPEAKKTTHGALETGDIINVSDDFAAHLVNDCRVAEYLDVIEPTDTPQPDAPETPEAKKTTRKTQKQAFDDAEQTAAQQAPVDDAIDTETAV
jgi:hypothetical protein